MTDPHALALIRQGNSTRLSALIERYTGYVSTIVWNIFSGAMTAQDAEEVTADVFMALWQSRPDIHKPRAYLAAMARNAARRAPAEKGHELPLDEEILTLSAAGPEAILDTKEQTVCLCHAIAMGPRNPRSIRRSRRHARRKRHGAAL